MYSQNWHLEIYVNCTTQVFLLPMYFSVERDELLKSICIHLRPRISAITSSILNQFQNFKQQCIANDLLTHNSLLMFLRQILFIQMKEQEKSFQKIIFFSFHFGQCSVE